MPYVIDNTQDSVTKRDPSGDLKERYLTKFAAEVIKANPGETVDRLAGELMAHAAQRHVGLPREWAKAYIIKGLES